MFGPPGYAYIYLIYGMHHCMNVVTEADGTGAAVLLRALEPISNLPGSASGPGRLCKAMAINKRHYGQDLCGSVLFIADDPDAGPGDTGGRPRIGLADVGGRTNKATRGED